MRPAYAWLLTSAVVILFVFGPLAYFLSHSLQIDSAPEFVYYRIGDALSIMGGEAAYVRPIQGIPNAILSKLAVWILGNSVVTREGSKAYGILFSLMLALPIVASMIYAWLKLPVFVALAQALILSLPFWFGSASVGLMVAPDYWQAELVFLAITLPLIFELPKLPADRAYIVAGIWSGIGASIKITLFPVSLLLILSIQQWKPARVAVMLATSFLTFIVLDLIYMADLVQAAKLFKFQALFYLRPNASAIYPDFWSAFLARPIVPMLSAAVLILCAAKRSAAAFAILGWLAVYLYLVAKRPHDTSMASFAISLGFMAAFLALQFESIKRKALILSALVAVAVVGASMDRFQAIRVLATSKAPDAENVYAENVALADKFFPAGAVWYMPSNDWNSTYGPQGFAYNGGLAINRPREKQAVFRRLFPGHDVALNLEEVPALLNDGAAIYWTRPIDSDHRPLFAALDGALIEEQHGLINGNAWIFGRAFLKGLYQQQKRGARD